jgi:predicted lipoprotein with Yx(FWY)xxD motif
MAAVFWGVQVEPKEQHSMNRTRVIVFAASAAFGLATVAACGGGNGGQAPAAGGGQAQPTSQPTDPNEVKLTATTVGALGQVVTDAAGMTLYRFDGDTANPPASNCDGPCSQTWPPELATSSTATLDGIDQSVVGVILRKDGTKQLTINGWAVYRYAKDTAPGDAKGQGLQQKWFAVTPQGKKAAGAPTTGGGAAGSGAPSSTKQASPTTSVDPGAGGYGY